MKAKVLVRLQSFLSKAGVTSRRHAIDLIKSGSVSVNGKKVFEKGFGVNPESDTIVVSGKKANLKESYVYIILNKPKDVISTSSDTHRRKTPFDFINKKFGRLFIAGRLDKDTTGFLLLTNDGEVANRLIHPRFEIPKLYEIIINRALKSDERKSLEKGIALEGKITLPVKIDILESSIDKSKLQLEMREGRKHQIKSMFGYFDIKIISLKRIGMANIKLGNLKTGEYMLLTEPEIKDLRKYLKLMQ